MQLVGVALVSTLSATLTVLLTTLVTVYEPAAGQVLETVSIKIVSPCVRPVIRALLDEKPKAPEPGVAAGVTEVVAMVAIGAKVGCP